MKKIFALGLFSISLFSLSQLEASVKEGDCAFKINGGVAPASLIDRGKIHYVLPNGLHQQEQFPRFGKIFNPLGTAGGEFAYGLAPDTEFFVDASYHWAKGKQFRLTSFPNSSLRFNDYNAWNFHGGLQYYFDLAQNFNFFAGVKLGVATRTSLIARLNNNGRSSQLRIQGRKATFSGGVRAGFDYALADMFSLGIQGEGLISPKIIHSTRITQNINGQNMGYRIGKTKALLSFPVMGYLRLRLPS
jgi:opacity protein-like surface antigen